MKNISIIDIIPQRPPFVMIDTLLYADKEKARSTFYIQPDNLFVENGFFWKPALSKISLKHALHKLVIPTEKVL